MVVSPCSNFYRIRYLIVRVKSFHLHKWRHDSRSFCFTASTQKGLDSRTWPKTETKSGDIQSLYLDTIPPSNDQIAAAKAFFEQHRPTKSWTASEWRQTQPHSESTFLAPEIAFLGRSNAGKSSLLNAILGDDSLNRVSDKPGKTKVMHAWALAQSLSSPKQGRQQNRAIDPEVKLTVLDMPGYGHGSHEEWGHNVIKYLTKRRQLRRVFVLLNPSHGIKNTDWQTLELLRSQGISHQVIASKCDQIKKMKTDLQSRLSQMQAEIQNHFGTNQRAAGGLLTLRDIIATYRTPKTATNKRQVMCGIQDLQWAVICAAGLEDYALSLLGPKRQTAMPLPEQQGQTAPPSQTVMESG